MVVGQQLDLFEPLAAALALRDTPYNSTAHALAEIVDNSIDARARDVDVLIMNRREPTPSGQSVLVVRGLAVIDNGHGMSPEVLAQALVVGGRPVEGNGIRRRMGKYGVGLPTSSLSQCQRVDIWSWQSGLTSAWRCHLYVDEVRAGNVRVPVPSQEAPPDLWIRQSRPAIANSESGTLVVWSNLDRVDWRTSRTTIERVEEEVGRIYRDFIQDGEVSLVMQSFDSDGASDPSHTVKPNDPLYLMTGTVHPHWKPDEPMFYKWAETRIPVTVNGAQYDVEIIYSRVKGEVLLEQGSRAAGATQHGQRAARNVGISVVREGRELMTLPPLNNLGDPRNRWWGCELRFNRACDDLFGVDHSKQLAARLQAVHRSVQRDRTSNIDEEEERARTEGDESVLALYDIVKTINQNTAEMFREIRRIRSNPPPPVPSDLGSDFSGGAGEGATRDIETAIDVGATEATPTEEERGRLAPDQVEAGLEEDLVSDGLEPDLAKSIASWAASRNVGYVINPGRVSGSALFDVRNDHGTIRIVLNQEHRLYRLLRVLSDRYDEDEEAGEEEPGDASLTLFLLLCAWARMVEQTPGTQARQRLEDVVMRWGSEANHMLATMTRRLVGEEE